jgi:hypothetical protein
LDSYLEAKKKEPIEKWKMLSWICKKRRETISLSETINSKALCSILINNRFSILFLFSHKLPIWHQDQEHRTHSGTAGAGTLLRDLGLVPAELISLSGDGLYLYFYFYGPPSYNPLNHSFEIQNIYINIQLENITSTSL